MAGGKLSPRQKMINLMYLVFIAMLALQMSKEVLTAFGYLNERMTTFNTTQNLKNEASYAGLEVKANEQPDKFRDENIKAKKIKVLSQELFDHVAKIKNEVYKDIEEDRLKDYEAMDKADILDFYLYQKGKVSENGQAFLDAIAKYRDGIEKELGDDYPDVSKSIQEYFNTDDIDIGTEGTLPVMINWIEHSFVGFPAVASITKLTVMQSDIRGAERNILNTMLGVQLTADAGISASSYQILFMPGKPTFFRGEEATGSLVLGRYDASLKPSKVVVNGQNISSDNFVDGKVNISLPSGNVGDHKIIGEFIFMQDGVEEKILIDQSYFVGSKPSDAVIAADKMNVVYRGLQNPMTISVPGVADDKVKASARGLRKLGPSKYMMVPGTGKEVSINVQFTLPDGSVENTAKKYRIKDIPKPMSTVRRESGMVKMPKSSLVKTTIRVELPDFLFDLNFNIQSFKVKVPGQATIIVTGNKLDAAAQSAVNKARVGDVINIFDVKSSIVGVTGLRVPDASPVSIEIQ